MRRLIFDPDGQFSSLNMLIHSTFRHFFVLENIGDQTIHKLIITVKYSALDNGVYYTRTIYVYRL